MKYVEAEGDNIDEAIARAVEQLGASRDQVQIEILASPTRGLLGFGAKKARVRATMRAPMLFDGEAEGAADEAFESDDESDYGADDEEVSDEGADVEEVVERPRTAPRREMRHEPPARPVERATLERARSILQDLLGLIGSEARVEIEEDGDGPRLAMVGDESGLLIGRRGQTLDALEYILNRIVTREEDEASHLVVDSQNYRTRRRQSLVDLAKRLGERARRRGKAVTLNPMSPRDRRIVHLALQDDGSLTTRSSGRGYYRKLLIIPSGGERRGRRPRRSQSGRPRQEGS
jgi:spoIIIJ-associated protein